MGRMRIPLSFKTKNCKGTTAKEALNCAGQTCKRRGSDLFRNGAPGAIPTRDLPLRSRIHEPFVFNSYEKA